MHYKESKGGFVCELRGNNSGGKGESSVFRSVEIKAQLEVADRTKGTEGVGEAETQTQRKTIGWTGSRHSMENSKHNADKIHCNVC